MARKQKKSVMSGPRLRERALHGRASGRAQRHLGQLEGGLDHDARAGGYGTALATWTPGDSDISTQPERDDAYAVSMSLMHKTASRASAPTHSCAVDGGAEAVEEAPNHSACEASTSARLIEPALDDLAARCGDLDVVVLDADGAALAVDRVDDLAHGGVPGQLRHGDAGRERDRAVEVVLGVVRRQVRHLGGDRRRLRREPVEREVERVAAVIHGDAAAGGACAMRRQSGCHSATPLACGVRKVSSVTRWTAPMRARLEHAADRLDHGACL